MSVDDYINKVLTRFAEVMTDRVFQMIEDDEQLKREYDSLAIDSSTRHALNARLGRRIREHFDLDNIGRCCAPRSKLIESFERHGRKSSET